MVHPAEEPELWQKLSDTLNVVAYLGRGLPGGGRVLGSIGILLTPHYPALVTQSADRRCKSVNVCPPPPPGPTSCTAVYALACLWGLDPAHAHPLLWLYLLAPVYRRPTCAAGQPAHRDVAALQRALPLV